MLIMVIQMNYPNYIKRAPKCPLDFPSVVQPLSGDDRRLLLWSTEWAFPVRSQDATVWKEGIVAGWVSLSWLMVFLVAGMSTKSNNHRIIELKYQPDLLMAFAPWRRQEHLLGFSFLCQERIMAPGPWKEAFTGKMALKHSEQKRESCGHRPPGLGFLSPSAGSVVGVGEMLRAEDSPLVSPLSDTASPLP